MDRVSNPRFGPHMRQLRVQQGLSLRQLAKQVLSSKSHLQEFEIGAKLPNEATADRIDQALHAEGELVRLVTVARSLGARMHRREFVGAAVAGLAGLQSRRGGGVRVNRDVVSQLRQRTARLRRLDDYLGGADTYQMYRSQLDSTIGLAVDGRFAETIERGLLEVVAEQAQMAGWAAFDAGWRTEADRLYRMSLQAAQDAQNTSLAGNALTFIAYGAERATSTMESACDMAVQDATPGVRTLLRERQAWAYAIAGNAKEAETSLALAETALHEHDDRQDPDWVFWVDHTEVQIMTGRCWATLHRPVRAIAALEQALKDYGDTHGRDKALYLSWLADAYIDAGEAEHAAAVASRATDLASGIGSVRPRRRIGAVAQRLASFSSVPLVADFLARHAEWAKQGRQLLDAPTPDTGPTPGSSLSR
ncbi:MAG: hypothetical protein V7603_3084 [Micromonosporaceae bacterium]